MVNQQIEINHTWWRRLLQRFVSAIAAGAVGGGLFMLASPLSGVEISNLILAAQASFAVCFALGFLLASWKPSRRTLWIGLILVVPEIILSISIRSIPKSAFPTVTTIIWLLQFVIGTCLARTLYKFLNEQE